MKQKKHKTAQISKETISGQLLQQTEKREKQVNIFLFFLLLAFGIYQAVIYWGHQVVPHPDFSCFAIVGRQILSFQMPTDFKRVPLLGILQVLLGKITGGQSPDFTGAWLLNSIAHSLTAVLFWLVGRKIIGRSAVWFALIAIINPWGLQLLTEGIAETTLLFFIWLTLYFIFIRSKWAYLFAALTSMVRYEGAALILCAFVLDMLEGKNKKERILAFVYASIASIPLFLWLAGTVFEQGMGTTHYFRVFTKEYKSQFVGDVAAKTGFIKHAGMLWQVGFYQLFLPSPQVSQDSAQSLMNLSKFFVLISFLFGSVYGLCKRQWKILVLLIFIVPYFWLHAKYPYPMPRYHATIFAIVLLICIYGLQSFWNLITGKLKLPKGIIIALQLVVILIAIIWALGLAGFLPRLAQMSAAGASLPYVAALAVLVVLAAGFLAYKESVIKEVAILALMILIIVSNQFAVAGLVGNGGRDIEFKYLADWYVQNAKKGEKLVTTMANLLVLMAPDYKDNFLEMDAFVDANSPAEFVDLCCKKNVTYVIWDSRIGFAPSDDYYKIWKMQNLAPLAAGRDTGPYQFITQLKANERRFVNVYRLRCPAN
ncbi:MAG: hypothetical protein NTW93_10400 [Phycisphaerae bacterium]|nr:hypothetical protein [Phycisphaerae bacterium]